MRNLAVLLTLLLFVGCAKPYSQFYEDQTKGLDITSSPLYEVPSGEPEVIHSNWDKVEQDNIIMVENGYAKLGYANFNGRMINEYGAIEQAKRVHASSVILYSRYTDTVSGAVPVTTPTTQTSTTNFYGSTGYSSFSGYGTTTTYGSQTSYVPYNVRRYDQGATFWIKRKIEKVKLGLLVVDLSTVEKQAMESNKGMRIFAVIKHTPAFNAELLRGDVLIKVGDMEINSRDNYQTALKTYAGLEAEVLIWRNGTKLTKTVQLNL